MYSCNDGHDEVSYESGACPVCEVIKECDEMEEKFNESEKKIENLTNDLSALAKEYA